MRTKTNIFIIPIVLLIILGGVYVAGCMYFSGHFFPGSTINGVDSSGLTPDTVEAAIAEAAKGYSIEVVDEGRGTSYNIAASDVAMETDLSTDEVSSLLASQSVYTWPMHLFEPTVYDTDHVVTMDRELLKKQIESLPCMNAADIVQTADATYELSVDKFVIVPEVFGTNIDADTMTDIVMAKMESLQEAVGLAADHCYVEPTVLADDENLGTLVDELNKRMAVTITYTLDKDTPIDKATQAGFLKANGTTVDYNREAIAAYVSELAKKVNTFGQNKTLKTSYNQEVVVPGGTYGWKVDEESEVSAIISDLDSGKDAKRELHYTYYANSHGENDYGNSYVEVNLTAQHLFLYKDGELVLDSDVVTGNPSRGNGTHVGAYFVAYKEKDAVLHGDNYETPVSFWMPFHGNEGMHDATWRSSFGGTIYKYNGSHGCVNCPFETAKTIFENVKDGYPVLVYELEGTESTKDELSRAGTVITAIDTLGEISLESEPAVVAARSAYDALSDTAKSYVTNISALEQAEATIVKLKGEAAIEEQKAEEAKASDKEKSKNKKKSKKND